MNGRFPHDVFAILLFPFMVVAASVFIYPLLIPEHVHHHLAVAIAIGAIFVVPGLIILRRRRGRDKVERS